MRERPRRFRINDDTMTTIVVLSLLFCVGVVVAGMVLAYFGVDVSIIVGNALTVFGTELGICGVMTIFNRWADKQEQLAKMRSIKRMQREAYKTDNEFEREEFKESLRRENTENVAG